MATEIVGNLIAAVIGLTCAGLGVLIFTPAKEVRGVVQEIAYALIYLRVPSFPECVFTPP